MLNKCHEYRTIKSYFFLLSSFFLPPSLDSLSPTQFKKITSIVQAVSLYVCISFWNISPDCRFWFPWLNEVENILAEENFVHSLIKILKRGNSLVVHWLSLHAPSAGALGLIPGQGTRSHGPQLRVHLLQLKGLICRNYALVQQKQTSFWKSSW